jgi:hypothetical protein
MVYACRICDYDESGDNKCVYRNDLLTVTKCDLCPILVNSMLRGYFREQVGVTTDLGSDPTLVRHIISISSPMSIISYDNFENIRLIQI